jgi:hypothetical protein
VALGWEEVQFAGQCPQFGLGDQRIGDVVGGPHPLPARVQRCIRGIESKATGGAALPVVSEPGECRRGGVPSRA